jgi:hypothetical protein
MNSSMRTIALGIRGPRLVAGLTAALLVLAALAWAVPARAATQTLQVTSTVDSVAAAFACPATVSNPCTLRLAIQVANSDTADTINVPAGTYTLTTHAEIPIRSAMNIVGADPRTTIIDGDSANKSDNRIFHVLTSPIDVGISNLTLQHAFCSCVFGGAIYNTSTGTLTLDNDSLVDNSLQTSGTSSGGAIYNGTEGSTHMVITRSLIARNQAQHGTDTTSNSEGGGILNQFPSTLSISNTTMTGNSSDGGGAIFNIGTTTLINDTVAGNVAALLPNANPGGGGLVDELPSSITLTNTIVSGNTNGDCRKWFGTGNFTSGGNNIDSDGSCFLVGTGDKPSTDPKLAALALNSPGQTSTMAIDATSPAYNAAGAAACPATDQRGVTRPQGAACDIGAYELVVVAPSPTPTPALPKAGSLSTGGPTSPGWVVAGILVLLVATGPALALRHRGRNHSIAGGHR